MTELRITVTNTSPAGGTFLTPTYFGFHDGAFDLFDVGEAASPGLESLAEDGAAATLAQERLAVSPDSQGIVVTGAQGPIVTQEVTTATIDIDGSVNRFASYGAMLLPSNDAFVGTDEAVTLFNEDGSFAGASRTVFTGADVYDAGTEVNTEEDAAFLNQTAPNTGVTEGGTVQLHPGFNGSAGNPGRRTEHSGRYKRVRRIHRSGRSGFHAARSADCGRSHQHRGRDQRALRAGTCLLRGR